MRSRGRRELSEHKIRRDVPGHGVSQDGPESGSIRRARHAQLVRRHSERSVRRPHRRPRSNAERQHRRGQLGHIRGCARHRARHCRTGQGQPDCVVAQRCHDVATFEFARSRETHRVGVFRDNQGRKGKIKTVLES